MPGLTPFQTVGPFFTFALPFRGGDTLGDESTPGTRVTIAGCVLDGAGEPVTDALIEIWQADANGVYRHPLDEDRHQAGSTFDGFGRTPTDDRGEFAFTTVKPGQVASPRGGLQAPHIVVGVLGRGILTRLVTRIYFEDEPSNATDFVLGLVPAERRGTLVARKINGNRYRFDVVVQGRNETVFFDV